MEPCNSLNTAHDSSLNTARQQLLSSVFLSSSALFTVSDYLVFLFCCKLANLFSTVCLSLSFSPLITSAWPVIDCQQRRTQEYFSEWRGRGLKIKIKARKENLMQVTFINFCAF